MKLKFQFVQAIAISIIINPRRACAARVTVVVLCVCLSVCLFVSYYSRTTGYEAVYERYQQLQCYKGMKNNVAIFLNLTTAFGRYGVKTSEKANIHTSTGFSRSAHRGRIKLLKGYVSKSSADLNPLTIT